MAMMDTNAIRTVNLKDLSQNDLKLNEALIVNASITIKVFVSVENFYLNDVVEKVSVKDISTLVAVKVDSSLTYSVEQIEKMIVIAMVIKDVTIIINEKNVNYKKDSDIDL